MKGNGLKPKTQEVVEMAKIARTEEGTARWAWAYSLVVALTPIASELRAQDTLFFTLMFKNQDFELTTQDGYDRIIPRRDNLYTSGNPGEPELPAYFANFIIPPGKVVHEVIVQEVNTRQIPGTYNIYPVQAPLWLEEIPNPRGLSKEWLQESQPVKFTDPDSSIYGSDSLWPGVYISDSANDGFFDGATIASVVVYPFQYRPLTGRLFLAKKITFKFILADVSTMPDRPAIRAPHIQPLYLFT